MLLQHKTYGYMQQKTDYVILSAYVTATLDTLDVCI